MIPGIGSTGGEELLIPLVKSSKCGDDTPSAAGNTKRGARARGGNSV
jgi:hypothetical protein